MKRECEFRDARRARSRNLPPLAAVDRHTKVRITIMLDNDILKFFRARAARRDAPAYQTQINQALRTFMSGGTPPDNAALASDDQLIARLAEHVALYAAAKKPRRARKTTTRRS